MPIVTSFRYIILYTNSTYSTTNVVLTMRQLSSLLYDNCRPYCTTNVVLTVRRVSSLLYDNCRPYCATTIRLIVRFFFIININFFGKTIQVYFFFIIFAIEISNDNILYSIITASKEVL